MNCPACGSESIRKGVSACPDCGEQLHIVADIDYTSLIKERTESFTGRTWVFQAIHTWLAKKSGPRVFLLSGDAGTGKTAIAARLTHISQVVVPPPDGAELGQGCLAYYHFCQVNNDLTLNPLRFVEYLSLRLANQFEPFAQALLKIDRREIQITPHQAIGEVHSGAQVVGVKIEHLTIGDLSPRAAFDELVRKPLEYLRTEGITSPILILVDSFDEALTFGANSIVQLLAEVTKPENPLSSAVRFLLTSRPDMRVADAFGEPALDFLRDAPSDVDEVYQYACLRTHEVPEPKRTELAVKIADQSKGNFLYTRYVLDGLLRKPDEIPALEELSLPADLEAVYRKFLERELGSDKRQWRRLYGRLLGVLTVAQGEGLTREQLAGINDLPQSDADNLLDVCGQYLAGPQPDGPFRIYHQSFRDYLLTNDEYQVYPVEANQAIADFFLDEYGSNREDCREMYALRHTPTHLAAAVQGATRRRTRQALESRLVALLGGFGFLQAKLNATDVNALLADLRLVPYNAAIGLAEEAIRRSAHVLARDKAQLAGQLLGRLLGQGSDTVTPLLEQARKSCSSPWLRPLTPTLHPPGGPLLRTLTGHTSVVTSVAVTRDGRRAVSGSTDHTLKVWDLESGELVATFTDEGAIYACAVAPGGGCSGSGFTIVAGGASGQVHFLGLEGVT